MKRTTILTVVMIIGVALFAVGMLASFAGPVAAEEDVVIDGDEVDTSMCTIEVSGIATDSAATSPCQPGSPDDGVTTTALPMLE